MGLRVVWSVLLLMCCVVGVVLSVSDTCSAKCQDIGYKNRIVTENQLTGTPSTEWDINGAGSPDIQGFATDISVTPGSSVQIKIRTESTTYRVDIYRLGYYNGDGARLMDTIHPAPEILPQKQPACHFEPDTLLVDCANWAVSVQWHVPSDAVSGIYVARLVIPEVIGTAKKTWRADRSPVSADPKFSRSGVDPDEPPGGDMNTHAYGAAGLGKRRNALREPNASHVYFVVRDDRHCSEILLQTMDTTWQAYNCWGTTNTYGVACSNPEVHAGSPKPPDVSRRAYKASFNRPFATRSYRASNMPFNSEYPTIRWLERNGYDVSYWTGVDAHRTAGAQALLQSAHKVYISVGHDEYWSGPQRSHVEAARDKGMSLAFFAANEVYWRVRFEPDNKRQDDRTLVVYKETQASEKIDPNTTEWTGTFRDGRSINPLGAQPENALTGTIYTVNAWRNDFLKVPVNYSQHRFWRHTSISSLKPGQEKVVPVVGLLGHEWDEDIDNGFRPTGLIHLSSTTVDNVQYIQDEGATYDTGTATHHLTMHKHESGAIVFGAGTCQWAWGLDGHHDLVGGLDLKLGDNCYSLRVLEDQLVPDGDRDIQQATLNLILDMGVAPLSPQPNLVITQPSFDTIPPVIIKGKISGNMVSGESTDVEGIVSSVEVSEDEGHKWSRVTNWNYQTGEWSHQLSTHGNPNKPLLVRATDDSGNTCEPFVVLE